MSAAASAIPGAGQRRAQHPLALAAQTGVGDLTGGAQSLDSLMKSDLPDAMNVGPRDLYQYLTATIESLRTALTSKDSEIRQALDRLGTGIMIWGPPGVGKTSIVKQVARDQEIPFAALRLGNVAPHQLAGVPFPDEKSGRAVWLPPKFTADVDIWNIVERKQDLWVLFLDEITTARPDVQAMAYQTVQELRLGGHRLPGTPIVILAGNRVTDRAVAYRMPSALRSRLIHLNLKPDGHYFEQWREWALQTGIHPAILAYLSNFPDDIYRFPDDPSANAYPCPRSWERLSLEIKLKRITPDSPTAKVADGIVGTGVGARSPTREPS